MSIVDANPTRDSDREWYARTRIRPDIIAEIGTTKFVLGLEIDAVWGQTGAADSPLLTSCTALPCTNGPNRFGATGGSFDLNTDLIGAIEVKWAYSEFRLPLVPWVTTVRLGAQPFEVMYKSAVYATGDFAGVHIRSASRRNLVLNLTYAQVEEASTGLRDGFARGDDFAMVASVEITPFKGLDVRPIYSLFYADGTTNFNARLARGGSVSAPGTIPRALPSIGTPSVSTRDGVMAPSISTRQFPTSSGSGRSTPAGRRPCRLSAPAPG
jgi:hypothetical protein